MVGTPGLSIFLHNQNCCSCQGAATGTEDTVEVAFGVSTAEAASLMTELVSLFFHWVHLVVRLTDCSQIGEKLKNGQ